MITSIFQNHMVPTGILEVITPLVLWQHPLTSLYVELNEVLSFISDISYWITTLFQTVFHPLITSSQLLGTTPPLLALTCHFIQISNYLPITSDSQCYLPSNVFLCLFLFKVQNNARGRTTDST